MKCCWLKTVKRPCDSCYRADAPQIALLDWEMPVLDGLDLCRAIRSDIHERYVHVLMLSGVHPDEHRIQALEAAPMTSCPSRIIPMSCWPVCAWPHVWSSGSPAPLSVCSPR
jgi:CheY-like chemotaxis protein